MVPLLVSVCTQGEKLRSQDKNTRPLFTSALGGQRVATPAQLAFAKMKNATGENAEYGLRDHIYFNLGIHLKSLFIALTDEDRLQKGLYDTASKLKGASEAYFARAEEVAYEYRKDKIAGGKLDSKTNLDQGQHQIKYFREIGIRKLDQLQEFQGRLENDPSANQSRLQMFTAFNEWSTLIKKGLSKEKDHPCVKAEALLVAHQNLLEEVADGGDPEVILGKIRMGYAYGLLKTDVTNFINNFESHVDEAVAKGFGEKEKVRKDFIQVAAYAINGPASSELKKEVETYFNNLQETYKNRSKAGAQHAKSHFNSELAELMKGPETITVEVLNKMSYIGDGLKHLPIFLREFFGNPEDFKVFANQAEQARVSYANSEDIADKLKKSETEVAYVEAELNKLQELMDISNIRIDARELSSISSKDLSDDQLKQALGVAEAQKVIDQRNLLNEIKDAIKSDKICINLNNKIEKLKKPFGEQNSALLTARQKLSDLQSQQAEIEKQLQAKKNEFNVLFLAKDEQTRRNNVSTSVTLKTQIESLESEIAANSTAINENKVLVEEITPKIKNAERLMFEIDRDIKTREAEIRNDFYKEKGIDFVDQPFFNISLNRLLELAEFVKEDKLKANSSIMPATQAAMIQSIILVEQVEAWETKQQEMKTLSQAHQESKKISDKASLDVDESIKKVFQTKLENLYTLHQLALYKDRVSAVSDILTEASNQSKKKDLETIEFWGQKRQLGLTRSPTILEKKVEAELKKLLSKIEHDGLELQLRAIHASKYLERRKLKEGGALNTTSNSSLYFLPTSSAKSSIRQGSMNHYSVNPDGDDEEVYVAPLLNSYKTDKNTDSGPDSEKVTDMDSALSDDKSDGVFYSYESDEDTGSGSEEELNTNFTNTDLSAGFFSGLNANL